MYILQEAICFTTSQLVDVLVYLGGVIKHTEEHSLLNNILEDHMFSAYGTII